jgi:hypothetical protein
MVSIEVFEFPTIAYATSKGIMATPSADIISNTCFDCSTTSSATTLLIKNRSSLWFILEFILDILSAYYDLILHLSYSNVELAFALVQPIWSAGQHQSTI